MWYNALSQRQRKNHLKKLIALLLVFALLLIATTPVFAADLGNSEPGIDRYLDNQGRQQASEVGAQCDSGAGSGTFGYLGIDQNMGINSDPTDPGANGYQTGLNNSAVCGNR